MHSLIWPDQNIKMMQHHISISSLRRVKRKDTNIRLNGYKKWEICWLTRSLSYEDQTSGKMAVRTDTPADSLARSLSHEDLTVFIIVRITANSAAKDAVEFSFHSIIVQLKIPIWQLFEFWASTKKTLQSKTVSLLNVFIFISIF